MAASSLAARIPKIHLHCHLEGALRAETFVELARKHGVPLRYRPESRVILRQAQDDTQRAHDDTLGASAQDDTGAERPYAFADHQEFLYLFAAVSRSLKDPDDYARLAREFVEDSLAQGVIYGELFVSPPVWTFFNRELDVRATMSAIVGELRRAKPKATFKLLPDLTRNFGPENAMATAQAVAGMTDLDVVGVSLGGDEARFPATLFADVFAFARAQGLRAVAHAGESAGPASVRDAVEVLGAERIGHGIHALEDLSVIELLKERRIALEVCPTSNRLTGNALAAHPHPFIGLDRLGCTVTIDADDPALFETSIAQEYELVERTAGPAALERFVRNAVEASFADPAEKRAMQASIDAAVAELRQVSRS